MTYREPATTPAVAEATPAKVPPPYPMPEALAATCAMPPEYPYSAPGFHDATEAIEHAAKALRSARYGVDAACRQIDQHLEQVRQWSEARDNDNDRAKAAIEWMRSLAQDVR